MAERIQTALLSLAEAFGTRNQEYELAEVISPSIDLLSQLLSNLRLTGADSPTSAVIGAGASQTTSVAVVEDTFVTGMWIQEPRCSAIDTCAVTSAYILRNQGGGFSQMTPLRVDPRQLLGGGTAYQRIFPLDGLPWGSLLRSGDLVSVTLFNVAASATTTGFTLGYRGFSGPPS